MENRRVKSSHSLVEKVIKMKGWDCILELVAFQTLEIALREKTKKAVEGAKREWEGRQSGWTERARERGLYFNIWEEKEIIR